MRNRGPAAPVFFCSRGGLFGGFRIGSKHPKTTDQDAKASQVGQPERQANGNSQVPTHSSSTWPTAYEFAYARALREDPVAVDDSTDGNGRQWSPQMAPSRTAPTQATTMMASSTVRRHGAATGRAVPWFPDVPVKKATTRKNKNYERKDGVGMFSDQLRCISHTDVSTHILDSPGEDEDCPGTPGDHARE